MTDAERALIEIVELINAPALHPDRKLVADNITGGVLDKIRDVAVGALGSVTQGGGDLCAP